MFLYFSRWCWFTNGKIIQYFLTNGTLLFVGSKLLFFSFHVILIEEKGFEEEWPFIFSYLLLGQIFMIYLSMISFNWSCTVKWYTTPAKTAPVLPLPLLYPLFLFFRRHKIPPRAYVLNTYLESHTFSHYLLHALIIMFFFILIMVLPTTKQVL